MVVAPYPMFLVDLNNLDADKSDRDLLCPVIASPLRFGKHSLIFSLTHSGNFLLSPLERVS